MSLGACATISYEVAKIRPEDLGTSQPVSQPEDDKDLTMSRHTESSDDRDGVLEKGAGIKLELDGNKTELMEWVVGAAKREPDNEGDGDDDSDNEDPNDYN